MRYVSCAKASWKKLFASAGVFSSRISAQTRYEMNHCWVSRAINADIQRPTMIKRLAIFFIKLLETIKVLVIVLINLISYVIVFVLAILRSIIWPCPIANKTPIINTADDIVENLRDTVNEKLEAFTRASSLIFTPFKETGFSNTWDEYDFWIMAKGDIINAAYSWDGFETIDIKLTHLTVFKSEQALQNADSIHETSIALSGKYIRIEVRPQVLKACNMPQPITAKTIIIKGQLLWDRDGFLEIHPKYGSDLMVF
jgi:hypothetical protein